MKADGADAAASAAGVAIVAPVWPKVAGIWAAVAAGFSSIPWAQLAAAAAFLYSLHLIVGWWIDRLGRRPARKPRR